MKKQLFFTLFVLVIFTAGFAQTVVFSDDFESYTSGNLLVSTSSHPEWMTWTQPYGAAEDVVVSTTQASQGNNSINVQLNKDIVLHLGDKTTGRYQIMFDIFPNASQDAYFNLLNDFNGNNSVWAFQVYFLANGTGTVDADGAGTASFAYTNGAWNSVNIIVDVDDDFATFYLNGVEIVSWVFSKGALGGGTMQKLDAVNFFGHTNNNYFVDDVIVYEQPSFTGPLNLLATLHGNDVDLTWDAPAGPVPDSYVIIANNSVIATGVAGTSYTHLNPYPGDYTYTVKAHYDGLGYSQKSNDADITIAGGVERNFVLIEKGTGTWCVYCPGAAMGLEQLSNEGHDVAVIAYHSGDSYETPDAASRLSYYAISSFPSVVFDGGNLMAGGNATQSLYPSYRPVYDEKITIPSLHSIDLQVEQTGVGTFAATIDVEQHSDYYSGDFKLFGVVTESSIMENWQNQTHLDFVFRSIYPSAAGQTVNFSSSTTYNTTINFTINSGWVKDNCEFIVFLQYPSTKGIMQTAKVDMSTIISVEDYQQTQIVIRPNPASDFVSVYANDMKAVHILSLTGQKVFSQTVTGNETHIDIQHIPSGIYLIQTETEGTVKTSKLVIQ
jgi:thiol-disulfide isomerase/thioredoxin